MEGNSLKVAVIIPAFNEEKNIGTVLEVLCGLPTLDEVIVVNDGSEDQTSAVAQTYGVRVIDLAKNLGKGGAMLAGAEASNADVLLFLDADLVGIRPSHINNLLEPVIEGRAEMAVGVFCSGRWRTHAAQVIAPFLSGQRAIYRKDLMAVPELDSSRYGVEICISRYAKEAEMQVEHVYLPDMTQVMKEEKRGLIPGISARVKMYWDIVRSLKVR